MCKDKKEKYAPSCLDMFEDAYEFYKAAHFLNSNFEIKYSNISSKNIMPMLVNICFACEVFIKTLLNYRKIELEKEHHLNKLFSKLPTNDIKLIKDLLIKDYELTFPELKMNIQKRLKEVSNYFKKLRYWYEYEITDSKRSIDYTGCMFLKKFCDVLIVYLEPLIIREYNELHSPILENKSRLNTLRKMVEKTND